MYIGYTPFSFLHFFVLHGLQPTLLPFVLHIMSPILGFVEGISSNGKYCPSSSPPQSCGSSRRERSVLPPVQPLVAGAPFPIAFAAAVSFLVVPSVCLSTVCHFHCPAAALCTPACASVVRDSERATTMLGWKNEHMTSVSNRPEKV